MLKGAIGAGQRMPLLLVSSTCWGIGFDHVVSVTGTILMSEAADCSVRMGRLGRIPTLYFNNSTSTRKSQVYYAEIDIFSQKCS